MRVLIILCLAAVTCASPAGYNYEPATADGGLTEDDLGTRSGKDNDESDSETFAIDLRSGGSDNDEFNDETAASDVSLNTAALEAIEADESNAYEQQADQPTESQETQQTYDSAAVSDYEETQQNSYSEPASDYEQTSASENENTAAEPGIDKEFYTFEANEEDFNDPAAKAQLSEQLHQSLSVIFVKGPEQSILDDAAVGLAKQTADQNTDIYVLDQQADIDALTNSLNALGSSKNNKPEVSFVKYRTTEDERNAVAAIEAEYESRGGTTQTHDGEVAETLDFASKRPVDSYGGEPSAPAAEYLPASIFRF